MSAAERRVGRFFLLGIQAGETAYYEDVTAQTPTQNALPWRSNVTEHHTRNTR